MRAAGSIVVSNCATAAETITNTTTTAPTTGDRPPRTPRLTVSPRWAHITPVYRSVQGGSLRCAARSIERLPSIPTAVAAGSATCGCRPDNSWDPDLKQRDRSSKLQDGGPTFQSVRPAALQLPRRCRTRLGRPPTYIAGMWGSIFALEYVFDLVR